MTAPSSPHPLRPLSMAEVLDRAFQSYRTHFATMFVVAVVTLLPMGLLYMIVGAPVSGSGESGVPEGVAWVALLLALPVTVLGWAALAEVAFQGAVRGGSGARDAMRKGLRVVLRVLGFGVALYIGLFLASMALMIPVVLAGAAAVAGFGQGSTAAGVVILGVAAVALAIGLVLLVWWGSIAALGLPVLVVEDVGVFGAFRRCHRLARGRRIRVVALAFVAWLAVLLPTFGILMLFGLGSAIWDPGAALTMTAREVYLQNGLLAVTGALTTPFVAASLVFIYLDRRIRLEGFDVELASASLEPGS